MHIRLILADKAGLAEAQEAVAKHHYLRAPVDSRCSPVAYLVTLADEWVVGCLIFGRPESTRCYQGRLTYGSLQDVKDGRAQFDRWELLNLARVWLDPTVQAGGYRCRPNLLPGYTDRRGVWRSTLASWAIREALRRVGYDYLSVRPPVFPDEPYEIRACLSYCDTSKHRGVIYRAAGFELARVNERRIETWWTPQVEPLTSYQHDLIKKAAWRSPRGKRLRARRLYAEELPQLELGV